MSTIATESGPRPGTQAPARQAELRALAGLASLVISFVVPLLSYDLIRPHVSSSAMALALAGAIPVAYTLAILVARRRLNPVGMVGAVSFGIGVLVSWASGGSPLALELQDPVLTGAIGIAFLASVAIGRPLHPTILRMLGRGNSRYADIASRAERRTSMVITTILGLTLIAHAVAIIVLALTQPTSAFVALQHPVGLPILGLGLAGVLWYRNRLQARQRAAAPRSGAMAPGRTASRSHPRTP
jgi:FtsH-binding integral membrane protein